MTDCCNSVQVQSSYSAMSSAFKEAILTTSELMNLARSQSQTVAALREADVPGAQLTFAFMLYSDAIDSYVCPSIEADVVCAPLALAFLRYFLM